MAFEDFLDAKRVLDVLGKRAGRPSDRSPAGAAQQAKFTLQGGEAVPVHLRRVMLQNA
jgi:hypothetical protein